ncbi:MAG TPA: NADH-quinone oxidoreductase subunit L [Coriobacteriia bacterium]|nr:NADH-quinone oxidoreductase subunit L [Coriobacteriia bacterium]
MLLIYFLVLFPLATAALLLVIGNETLRRIVTICNSALIMGASVWLTVEYLSIAGEALDTPLYAKVDSELIGYVLLGVSVIISLYIIAKSIQHKRRLPALLVLTQLAALAFFELNYAHGLNISADIRLDALSIIMVLIIGIIGGGICIFSLGYMQDHESHAAGHAGGDTAEKPRHRDRRRVFFALMFLFLSAMYLIVIANNLTWFFTAWELTTVCSFALIGYTRTQEAIDNSFRQVVMNLLGGLAFAIALLLLGMQGIGELSTVIADGQAGLLGIPIALLAFAGITKAAQMPFQSWLLGAMVAPTPTSALLHSSTMVKAGVFLLIRLAPAFGFTSNGIMVMLIGALTFLFCSLLAISQSNAKRVLAYSTVANLGLIVACAGVGTPEAVWAAIFLLIFHAAAKSLLFLCVGSAEHKIGSRDIEAMDNVFVRLPKLARLMALGILVMFLAPFGMLISKWATLVSFADTNNYVLLIILAFGSAATFMFWTKWLGKLLAVSVGDKSKERGVHPSEWAGIAIMALLTVALSVGFPFISEYLVVPSLGDVSSTIGFDNLLIMSIIVVILLLAFAVFFGRSSAREVDIYLSGVGLDSHKREYLNSLSQVGVASQRNWYMDGWFGEKALVSPANIACIIILALGAVVLLFDVTGISLPLAVSAL